MSCSSLATMAGIAAGDARDHTPPTQLDVHTRRPRPSVKQRRALLMTNGGCDETRRPNGRNGYYRATGPGSAVPARARTKIRAVTWAPLIAGRRRRRRRGACSDATLINALSAGRGDHTRRRERRTGTAGVRGTGCGWWRRAFARDDDGNG